MRKQFFILLVLLLGSLTTFGQDAIFAGQIVDEHDKAIQDATIRISKTGELIQEVTSDRDGLFYSRLLPVGNYRMDVIVGEQFRKAKRVYLADCSRKRSYYHLKVLGDKLRIVVDGQDPLIRARVSRIELRHDHFMDFDGGPRSFIFFIDSATGRGAMLGGQSIPAPSTAR